MGFIDTKSSSYSKGRAATANQKSDDNLPQWGGEGGGKSGDVPGRNSDVAFTPGVTPNPGYTGKGRNLKIEDF
jgi:hypothetical protein